jgi:hypothetical protein
LRPEKTVRASHRFLTNLARAAENRSGDADVVSGNPVRWRYQRKQIIANDARLNDCS